MSTSIAEVGAGVISERNELHGTGWRDCTYAAFMRMCADAGVIFPLADDLDREREALERSDTWPDEQGAPLSAGVEAAMHRYGFAGHEVTALRSALLNVGQTLVVQGTNSRLPAHLRRWDPAFTDGHAVAVRVEPAGCRWLDPEAPMGYAGEIVALDTILHWAWGAQYARQARAGEVSTGDPMISVPADVTINSSHFLVLLAGTVIYQTPNGIIVKTISESHEADYIGDAGKGWSAIEIKVPPSIAYVKLSAPPVLKPPIPKKKIAVTLTLDGKAVVGSPITLEI